MIVQVIPDINLDNKGLEALLTNIHAYRGILSRLNIKERKIFPQNIISYEIVLSKNNISFYYIIPEHMKDLFTNEFNICYPRSAIKIKNDNYSLQNENGVLNIENTNHIFDFTKACEFELEKHSFLSLKVNRHNELPMSAFLETSKVLRNDEKVLIQYILNPLEQSTSSEMERCIEEFNSGHLVTKSRISAERIAKGSAKLAYGVAAEVLDLLSLFITNQEYEKLNIDEIENKPLFGRGLSQNTKDKALGLYYDASIRVATNSNRADLILTLVRNNLNHMNEDNKLIQRRVKQEELREAIINRKPLSKLDEDALSMRELAQLMQLPTKYYQQLYNIANIDTREMEVPKIFTKEGIQIGYTPYRGKKIPLYFPIDDLDSLCQTWISIGKMGSGKTTNGENLAIQLLQKGVSVFAIDVADGKLIDHIEQGLPQEFDKIIDLDFGDTNNPIPLSWNELAGTEGNRDFENRIASQLKNFLNKLAYTETSDRMDTFLGAAARAVFKNPNANLYDVILCLTDKKYRKKIIKQNGIEGRLKYTLERLDDDKTGTKQNYIAPIMDRIEALLDNQYVANCLLQNVNTEINFRKWADEGYFVGIRIPKDRLMDDATDLLVTYIVSKLWLSILSRYNIDESQRHPCMLILDEPHQFPTVFKELYSIIREMRKWRLGMIILAHEFGDFKTMKSLLKNAGTNYFIYNTSKDTYKELLEELAPFTLEEMLATKWHHSIVNMRYKDQNICVQAEMLNPLPKHSFIKPSNIYGNSKEQVEEDIFDKSMKLS